MTTPSTGRRAPRPTRGSPAPVFAAVAVAAFAGVAAALAAKAQQILDSSPGFVFSAAGPVRVNHDLGYLAWHFGPRGSRPS